jgi:hypothetical protein
MEGAVADFQVSEMRRHPATSLRAGSGHPVLIDHISVRKKRPSARPSLHSKIRLQKCPSRSRLLCHPRGGKIKEVKGTALRHASICFLLFLLTSFVSAQQDFPRAEVFGGYSYLHVDTEGAGSSLNSVCSELLGANSCPAGTFKLHNTFSGWTAAAQVNANRWLGLKADLSSDYGTPITLGPDATAYLNSQGVAGLPPAANSFSYLFGPVVTHRFSRYGVFGQALFGANRAAIDLHLATNQLEIPAIAVSNTALAMVFGGGVDTRIAQHLAFRAEADYLYTGHDFTSLLPAIAAHQNNLRASIGIVYRFGGEDRATASPAASPSPHTPRPSSSGQGHIVISSLGITAAIGDNQGAEIADEAPNGVAALANMHSGDVIVSVDGKSIKSPMELSAELANHAPGDHLRIGFLIHGQWQSETVVILGH